MPHRARLLPVVPLVVACLAATVALPGAGPAAATDGTPVGGVLAASTTWTAEGSPYRVGSTVQVPAGVTLTLAPGTRVVGEGVSALFQVHGSVVAAGTSARRVEIDGGRSADIFSGKGADDAHLQLDFADVHSGRALFPPTGHEQHAEFQVRDSWFRGLSEYSYLWYPTADSVFERNVFADSAGFSVGTRDVQVVFQDNRFSGASRSGYWVRQWAAYGPATVVTGNTFTAAGSPVLELQDGYDRAALNAPANHWSTTDPAVVERMVADSRDSIERAGVIPVDPLLDAPTPRTPAEAPARPSAAPPTASPAPTAPQASPSPVRPPVTSPTPVSPTPVSPTPVSPTPTAQPTADASPSPTRPPLAPSLSLSAGVVDAGRPVTVTYRGTPGSTLEVLARTQPARSFSVLARVVLDAGGTATTTHRPQRSTRLSARAVGGPSSAAQPLVQVRSVVSLAARRTAARTFTLTGRVYPARDGRLVSLYRGSALVGQARTGADGVYSLRRALPAGSATLVVRTVDDAYNLGATRALRLTVS